MNILLDSHVVIWALMQPELLSPRVDALLRNLATTLYVSSASVWEIGIKVERGKMPAAKRLLTSLEPSLQQLGARELPIRHSHARSAADLPAIHRDPFDRMLVAQSMVEGLPLISNDSTIQQYPIAVIW